MRPQTPRIVAPPNTAAHSLANSEASSPRIMAEPPPEQRQPPPVTGTAGLRLSLPQPPASGPVGAITPSTTEVAPAREQGMVMADEIAAAELIDAEGLVPADEGVPQHAHVKGRRPL